MKLHSWMFAQPECGFCATKYSSFAGEYGYVIFFSLHRNLQMLRHWQLVSDFSSSVHTTSLHATPIATGGRPFEPLANRTSIMRMASLCVCVHVMYICVTCRCLVSSSTKDHVFCGQGLWLNPGLTSSVTLAGLRSPTHAIVCTSPH